MASQEPEAAKRCREPHSELGFAGLSRPVQRGSQVVVFALEPVSPSGLVNMTEAGPDAFGQCQAPGCLALPSRMRFARRFELLERVLADGLEHRPAWFAIRLLGRP